jgi:hypothetical protein
VTLKDLQQEGTAAAWGGFDISLDEEDCDDLEVDSAGWGLPMGAEVAATQRAKVQNGVEAIRKCSARDLNDIANSSAPTDSKAPKMSQNVTAKPTRSVPKKAPLEQQKHQLQSKTAQPKQKPLAEATDLVSSMLEGLQAAVKVTGTFGGTRPKVMAAKTKGTSAQKAEPKRIKGREVGKGIGNLSKEEQHQVSHPFPVLGGFH